MGRWGLAFAAAVALIAAVPAAASHHPPNSVPGHVSLTVDRGGPRTLVFTYTVETPKCPGNPCVPGNFGRPYHINLFVEGPDGAPAYKGIPSLSTSVGGNTLPGCFSATQPVVVCDSNARNADDPSTVLPLQWSFSVTGNWVNHATAEIVVEGFTLNSYQEGVALPPNCTDLEAELFKAEGEMRFRKHLMLVDLHALGFAEGVITNLGINWVPGTAPALSRSARAVDRARADFEKSLHDAEKALAALKRAQDARDACQQRKTATPSSARAECTLEQFGGLVDRAAALELHAIKPLVTRILAEGKATKRTAYARDLKRLRVLIRADVKKIDALEKKLRACT